MPKTSFRVTPGLNLLDAKLRLEASVERYDDLLLGRGQHLETAGLHPAGRNGPLQHHRRPDEVYAYGNNLTNELGLTEGNPRAGQIISGEAGSLYGIGRPEFGRSFRAAPDVPLLVFFPHPLDWAVGSMPAARFFGNRK